MSPQKKKIKTRTPRPKPRPLKLKQAKLKQSDPRQRYLPSYEIELGIQPVPTLSGDMSEALCKFCIAFGREEKPQNAAGPFEALLTNEKRKQATTKKAFRSFRRDNIISHMKDQHKTKYEEFISLPKGSRLRLSFFRSSYNDGFFSWWDSQLLSRNPQWHASVSIFKVAKHIGNAALYSSALYNEKIDEIEQHRLENGLSNAITGFITGINEIKIEVKGAITATTSTTPIDIIAMEDMTEFRQLILPYRNRLRRQYGNGVISCIWKQVRKLRETYEFDSTFKDIVVRSCNRDIVQAWKLVDAKGEYTRLVSFALGLASIPPGTHTVEGDFSSLKGVKSAHRGSLSNYALEGQLQAKQYFELIPLANSVAARSLIEK